jgi:hypothetical protein
MGRWRCEAFEVPAYFWYAKLQITRKTSGYKNAMGRRRCEAFEPPAYSWYAKLQITKQIPFP